MFARRRQVIAFVLLGLWALSAGGELGAQEPLTLHEAIERALRSPAIEIADAQVGQALGSVRQAGLGPNPRLYLQSEDIRPWADNISYANQTEDYGYIGQTFELAGKRAKRVAFANARLHEAEDSRDGRRKQIIADVSAAYWNAVSQTRVSELLHDDLQAVDEVVRYHRARVDAGAMRGVDLVRIEI